MEERWEDTTETLNIIKYSVYKFLGVSLLHIFSSVTPHSSEFLQSVKYIHRYLIGLCIAIYKKVHCIFC